MLKRTGANILISEISLYTVFNSHDNGAAYEKNQLKKQKFIFFIFLVKI